MLIDFSDILQTNVYILGTTYMKLVFILHLRDSIPFLDPALYIARFAARLEFDDLMPKVIHDSLRLVSRMDRDWIKLGRRPSGICAAGKFNYNGLSRAAILMQSFINMLFVFLTCSIIYRRKNEWI